MNPNPKGGHKHGPPEDHSGPPPSGPPPSGSPPGQSDSKQAYQFEIFAQNRKKKYRLKKQDVFRANTQEYSGCG